MEATLEQRISDVLAAYDLRHTLPRTTILALFLRGSRAFSQPEIERTLQDICDRVTIYRTLSIFLEKGILHKVLDDAGAMKYALCPPACRHESHTTHHHHDHAHFKCVVCGNTNCLNDVAVRLPDMPTGFVVAEINILLQGTCPTCA